MSEEKPTGSGGPALTADLLAQLLEQIKQAGGQRLLETTGLLERIDEARGQLGAALVQSLPTDDQIIMEHVRAAKRELDRIRAIISG